jgi:hypothetical protein
MKQGQYIQHRTRTEWGIGCVLHRAGDRVEVQFDHGLVLLDFRVAGPLFQQVFSPEPSQVAHLSVMRKATARPRKPKKIAQK